MKNGLKAGDEINLSAMAFKSLDEIIRYKKSPEGCVWGGGYSTKNGAPKDTVKKPLRSFEGSRSHFFKKLRGLRRLLGFL